MDSTDGQCYAFVIIATNTRDVEDSQLLSDDNRNAPIDGGAHHKNKAGKRGWMHSELKEKGLSHVISQQ